MKSIFLAETERHVRDAIRLRIEHHPGLQMAGEADNTESLLAQVCRQPPDVILLDWNLPGIHHRRLISTLREHCPATQLVATSVRPEQEKTVKEWGLDGFLLKQLSPNMFIAALETVIFNSSDEERT